MAKAQGKKAVAAGKKAAKKVVARVKSAAGAAKKKVAPKKSATPPKPAAKKAAPKPAKPAAKKAAAKAARPVKKAAAKVVKKAAKAVKTVAKTLAKTVEKKVVAKAKKVAPAPKPKAPPKAAAPKAPAAKTTALKLVPKALPPAEPKAAAPVAAPAPARAPEPEKKRGRRARPRVTSSGVPAAAWLSTEKPRPASFIPAPARAEAPSAVAAPPASSDRLIRPDDVDHPAVRTVPVRIDVEQGAGRYYVIANPLEVSVRPGEGIEWDFRYLGGADVSVEEVVIEFEKPSPFTQTVFRTRKPGGARPHRQMSDGALPAAAGRRIQYTVRAINPFKTELANTKIWVTITS
ncbi:MAG TPA: hypothetical protein VE974_25995 [Thermoanaerobaculia bacterium]|nr:hypothetical protein [Thermoanaerobaculia bacterium]